MDVGGYHGETSQAFADITSNQYKRIYVFEPNEKLANICRSSLANVRNCSIIQKGAWDSEETFRFVEAGEGSRIDKEADCVSEIRTISIDEVLAGETATYIKMDVEGAEINALRGAKQTITKYKPKLAISVYHKRDDIWEIPKLLLQYNPEYRFYLRVYSFSGNDTVLYAL